MRRVIDGAVVVVTGSSGGIGRETANLLGQKQAKLVLNGRNEEKLATSLEYCKSNGASAVETCVADVSTEEGARQLIDFTLATYGRIDILINNAGISNRGPFIELQPSVAEELVRVNILGYVYPTLFALPQLLESRGYILFVSSISGICGFPGVSMYSASKMAITSLAQSLRSEYSHKELGSGIIYLPSVENDPDKRLLTNDGKRITYTRNFALTQKETARRMVNCIIQNKQRYIMTAKGKFAWIAQHYTPWLADLILSASKGRFHSVENDQSSTKSPSRIIS